MNRDALARLVDTLNATLDGMEDDHRRAVQLEEHNPVLFKGTAAQSLQNMHELAAIRDDVLADLHRLSEVAA